MSKKSGNRSAFAAAALAGLMSLGAAKADWKESLKGFGNQAVEKAKQYGGQALERDDTPDPEEQQPGAEEPESGSGFGLPFKIPFFGDSDFDDKMDKVEDALREMSPAGLGVQAGNHSAALEFIQSGLSLLGQKLGKESYKTGADGYYGSGTRDALNAFIKDKFSDTDVEKKHFGTTQIHTNYQHLDPVKKASDIGGDDMQALLDSLRDEGLLTPDSTALNQKLEAALGEIDLPALKDLGKEKTSMSASPKALEEALNHG